MEYLPSLKELNGEMGLEPVTKIIGKKKKREEQQLRLPGGGEVCRHCGTVMERRGWKRASQKELDRPFYYAQWDKCDDCGRIYMYEKYKVYDKKQPWELNIFK